MFRKLTLSTSLILALCLAGGASAALPAGWTSADIGTTGGSANESGGVWNVAGDGADIWGNADAFHYAYTSLPGDGMLTARVTSNGTGTNTWAKGGIMARATLGPDSHNSFIAVTAGDGGGLTFQIRPTAGAGSSSQHTQAPTVSPPHWVRLERKGSQFSAYRSTDGSTWTQQGTTQTVEMGGTIYIGLAVTSHAAGEVRTFKFDNVTLEMSKVSANPSPADGALHPETWANLSWSAGAGAASHNVYFSDDRAAVEAGAASAFAVNTTNKWSLVGIASYPYPSGLSYGATYYWRVDEVDAGGTVHAGDLWSFSVPPKKAYRPSPADGMAIVPVDGQLSWTAGHNAVLHYVNISTDYDAVANAALGSGALSPTTIFDPTTVLGNLAPDTTYYWRVDESIPPVTWHQGDVWSFTTAPEGITGELVFDRWLGGIGIDALRSLIDSGNRAPDETGVVTGGFYWDGPDTDNYGAKISGWLYAPATGDYRFWIVTDDNGRLYLSSDQSPGNMTEIARETGWTGLNTWNNGEERSAPIPLVAGQRYYIEAIWQEGGGGDHCQVGWAGPGIGSNPTTIASQYLSPFDPVEAYGSLPSDGAVDVKQDIQLRWVSGKYATSHDVYFGTSEAAVAAATKVSPEFKGSKPLGGELFDPGLLQLATTYYWRVDEVNSLHPDSPWTGEVWSFTTGDFLVIDDMEDYNNFTPDRVFETWIDGWGNSANGSIIGYPAPDFDADETFVETSIVHGGDQSMPYFYDTNMKYSEANMTLPAHLKDWTQEGVKAVSLWYHGYPTSQGAFAEGPVGTYTMTGAGGDIWNIDGVEADEFHYAWKQLQGSGSMTVKVGPISGANLNAWAKAGIMIRETLDPNSAHAFMAATNTEGVAFQYRPGPGEASANHHQKADEDTRPIWIRLERSFSGDFTGYHANDVGGSPDKWTAMNMSNIQMASTVYIGLALTSHQRYVPATVTFSNVTTTGSVIGATFAAQDIGIQSNSAESMFVSITDSQGRSATVYNTDAAAANVTGWTAWGEYGQGIALSEFTDKTPGLNLGSINAISIGFGTPGNTQPGGSGLVFFDDIRLYRPVCVPQLAKPALDFSNNCVVDIPDLQIMTDDWLNQPSQMVETVWGGAWSNADVGTTDPAGSFTIDGTGNFTITGAGADIWGTADGFHFASQALSGDGQITVRINSLDDTNGWAKAGVMIRDTMDPNSAHAMMVITPSSGASFQRRPVAGGASQSSTTGGLTAPICLSIARVGNTITGYYSTPNGWVRQGSVDIPMTGSVRIGIAVTSHSDGTATTATGDRNCPALVLETDANADGIVDFMDYAALMESWLDEVLWP